MVLQWYGHACFKIQGNQTDASLVLSPFEASMGRKLSRLSADIVIISKDTPEFNAISLVKGTAGDPFLIQCPGEYEVKKVFVTGVAAQKTGVTKSGKADSTILYSIGIDDVTIGHLGDIDRPLTESELDALGRIDILLLPVGGHSVLGPQLAVEVLNQIEPRVAIPMMYALSGMKGELESVERFLKEYGIKDAEKVDRLKMIKRDLPAEETRVILLNAE